MRRRFRLAVLRPVFVVVSPGMGAPAAAAVVAAVPDFVVLAEKDVREALVVAVAVCWAAVTILL